MAVETSAFGEAVKGLLASLQRYQERWAGCAIDPAGWAGRALALARERHAALQLPVGDAAAVARDTAIWLSPVFIRRHRPDLDFRAKGALLRERAHGNLGLVLAGALGSGAPLEDMELSDAVKVALPGQPGPAHFIAVAAAREVSIVNDLLRWRKRPSEEEPAELRAAACAVFLACPAEDVAGFPGLPAAAPEPLAPTVKAFDVAATPHRLASELVLPFVQETEALSEALQRMSRPLLAGKRVVLDGDLDLGRVLGVLGTAGCETEYRALLEARRRQDPAWDLAHLLACGRLHMAVEVTRRLGQLAEGGQRGESVVAWAGVRKVLQDLLGQPVAPGDLTLLAGGAREFRARHPEAPGGLAAGLAGLLRPGEPANQLLHCEDRKIREPGRADQLKEGLAKLEAAHPVEEIRELRDLLFEIQRNQSPSQEQREARVPGLRFDLPHEEDSIKNPPWMRGEVRPLAGPPGRFAFPASLVESLVTQCRTNATKYAVRGSPSGFEASVAHLGNGRLRFSFEDNGIGLVDEEALLKLRSPRSELSVLIWSGWFTEVWVCGCRGSQKEIKRIYPSAAEPGAPTPPPRTRQGTTFHFETSCLVSEAAGTTRAVGPRTGPAPRLPGPREKVLLIDDVTSHASKLGAWLASIGATVRREPGPLVGLKPRPKRITQRLLPPGPFGAVVIHGSYGKYRGIAPGLAVRALAGEVVTSDGEWAFDLELLRLLGAELPPDRPILVVTGGGAEELIPDLGAAAGLARLRVWNAAALCHQPTWAAALAEAPAAQAPAIQKAGRHRLDNFIKACQFAFDATPWDTQALESTYFKAPGTLEPARAAATAFLSRRTGVALVKAIDAVVDGAGTKGYRALRVAARAAEEELSREPG